MGEDIQVDIYIRIYNYYSFIHTNSIEDKTTINGRRRMLKTA